MNNNQLLTLIVSILIPNLGMWFYLMKHSKDIGIIEGFLFKELKNRTNEKGDKNDR